MANNRQAKNVKGRPRSLKPSRGASPRDPSPTASTIAPAPTSALQPRRERYDGQEQMLALVTSSIDALTIERALPTPQSVDATADSDNTTYAGSGNGAEQHGNCSETRKGFTFLSLPAELRLQVYAAHFSTTMSRAIDITAENVTRLHPLMLPLFQTCRQVHREASHYFYTRHTFRLFPTDPRRFNRSKKPLIARFKPHLRALLTTLELRLGPGWARPPQSWVVNRRLKLEECVGVRQLQVLIECDPGEQCFDGFRRADGFYENFCRALLDDVLCALPNVESVRFDAWTSVRKNGGMMRGLLREAISHGKRICWGPERGWGNDNDDDCEGDVLFDDDTRNEGAGASGDPEHSSAGTSSGGVDAGDQSIGNSHSIFNSPQGALAMESWATTATATLNNSTAGHLSPLLTA